MDKLVRKLTLKYAILQSTYWVSQCAIGSFAAVFLKMKNFDNTQIGIVLSFASVFSIILQLIVATFADKTKKISLRSIVIVLMFLVLALGIILYIAPYSFLLIAINFGVISALQTTLNPLFNSLAVEYLNKGVQINYGLARGTGSISFAITSYFLGSYVTHNGPSVLIPVFLISYCFVIISAFVFKTTISELSLSTIDIGDDNNCNNKIENNNMEPTGTIEFFIKYKKYMFQLLGIAMLFYSHNIICTYLYKIIENLGGNSTDMGISLAITATVELPTMSAFVYLVSKIKCHKLIKISAFFFFIKVAIAWLAPNIYVVHFSQALQIFAYALFTPASVYYVNTIIEKQDKVKGQSMLGVAMCVAGTIANITGGKVMDLFGVSATLLLGTVVTACGFIIVCFSTEKIEVVSS